MNVRHLSTTLIAGWILCQLRAWNSYATRNTFGNDFYGSEPTRFGNVVHDVMEAIHRSDLDGQPIPHPLDLFDEYWAKSAATDLDYHTLGRSGIEDFARRSFDDRPEGSRTIGVEFHFMLDLTTMQYYDLNGLLFENIQDLLDRVLMLGGVPVISKIDRLDSDGARLYVYDYKTNAMPFTRDEIDNSTQLMIYDMAARAWAERHDLYVEEVICTYDMFRHGRFVAAPFSDQKREDLRQYLINQWHQIDQTKVPVPTINQYCHVCEIRGNCPAYIEVLETEVQPILTDDTDLAALVTHFEELKARAKVLDNRIKEMGAMLSTKVVTADGEPVQVDENREVFLSPNPRYSYDTRKIIEILRENNAMVLLSDIVNISNTNLDRALKSAPFKEEIQALKEKGFAKSSLKVRAIKGSLAEGEVDDE